MTGSGNPLKRPCGEIPAQRNRQRGRRQEGKIASGEAQEQEGAAFCGCASHKQGFM